MRKILIMTPVILTVALLLSSFMPSHAAASFLFEAGRTDKSSIPFLVDAPQAPLAMDVSIHKSASPEPVTVGSQLTYTIVVSNPGTDQATGVAVQDTLPAQVSLSSADASCTGQLTLTCAIGTLDPGQTRTIIIVVNTNVSGSVENTATLTLNEVDTIPSNNTSTATTTIAPAANLSIAKSGPAQSPLNGSQFSYTLLVGNSGPDTAASVVVADNVPANVSVTSASLSGGSCTFLNNQVSCSLNSLAKDATATVTIVVTALQTGTFNNTATVTSSTTDPAPGNNTSTISTAIAPAANLSIAKSGPAQSPLNGSRFSYTLQVGNSGPDTAASVVVADNVPANVRVYSASTSLGSCTVTNNQVSCSLNSLAKDATATVTIVVDALQSGTFNNTATVTSSTADPASGNNTSTISTTILAAADLAITKTGPSGTVYAGGTIIYTLTINNSGPNTATAVQVSDSLPSGLSNISIPAGCTRNGNLVTCSLGSINLGSNRTLQISGTAPIEGNYSNTATVSASTADPASGNNSSTVNTTVLPSADISVTKTAPSSVLPGVNLTYTIQVRNNGPSTAQGVWLDDTLPAIFTSPTVTSPLGIVCSSSNTVTCNIGTMAASSTVTITIVDQVPPGTPEGVITNTAQVRESTRDPVSTNDTATLQTTITNKIVNLRPVVTDSQDPVVASNTFTYRINVYNDGPSNASSVVITATLPAGVTLSSADPDQGSCSGSNPVICAVGGIPVGGHVFVAMGVLTNPATVGTITGDFRVDSAEADENENNNHVLVETTVRRNADLRLSKTASGSTVIAGTTLGYTLGILNSGPSLGAGVRVTDTLPAGVTFLSFTPGTSQCGLTGSTITCQLGNLSPNTSKQVGYTVRVNSGTTGSLQNSARLAFGTHVLDADPNPGNNTASVVTPVNTQANLALTVTDSPDPIKRGDILVYTLSVLNGGPSNALNVILTDQLPGNVTLLAFPSGSPCSAKNQGASVECNFGTMLAGANRQVTISVRIGQAATGALLNRANVASSTTDPSSTNNSVETTTTVDTHPPSLSWVSPGPGGGYYQDSLIYHLQVNVNDDLGVGYVSFARWDPVNLRWVELARDTTAPYSWELGPGQAPSGWNQIGAIGYDRAGNKTGDYKDKWVFVKILWFLLMPIVFK